MTTATTILEVALNGPWGRAKQPRIPVAVDEIVADAVRCVAAGAAVVHVHPYDVATGRQKDDPDLYVAIVEGVRAQVDAIVYPTAPFVDAEGRGRYAITEALAARGLIEWATVDPGTLDVARYDDLAAGRPGFVYRNDEATIDEGLAVAARHGIVPSYACYEPGFVRLGAALHRRHPGAPHPLYRLMFSDEFAFGFPAEPWALDAYRALLDRVAPGAPVMVAGLGVDLAPLIAPAVAAGWHVRTGLEDARFGATDDNAALTARAARAIEAAGGRLATVADARRLVGGRAA